MRSRARSEAVASQGEALAVWAVWAAVGLAMLVTYARLPVGDLYRVDEGGLAGALGRVLVFVNFPVAIVAVALTLVALDALPRRAWIPAAVSIALCAVIIVPGVVDELDLDARRVNVVPAVGVAVAFVLTAAAARRAGAVPAPWQASDALRLAAAAVILALSLPWFAAELGWYLPEGVFVTERVLPESDGTRLAAVHVGHHHGLDGALLALSAILLSRVRIAGRRLAAVVAGYLSLMLAYGLVNAAEDLWHEQVVKRGWADWRVPAALRPDLAWIWLVILMLAAASFVAMRKRAQ